MKKILYFLVTAILFSNVVVAQDDNAKINQMLQTTSMPTDQEIMQMVQMFASGEEEKQLLFNETKKRLEQMYVLKDASAITDMYKQMSNVEQIQNNFEQNIQPQKSPKQQNTYSKPKKRVKKYSNHAPLTRRSKEK